MTELVNQPTAALTRKQFWSFMASGSTTIILWIVETFVSVEVPIEVAGTMITMAGMAGGYAVRDRKV